MEKYIVVPLGIGKGGVSPGRLLGMEPAGPGPSREANWLAMGMGGRAIWAG